MDGLIQYYCNVCVSTNRGIFFLKFEGKVLIVVFILTLCKHYISNRMGRREKWKV